MPLADSIGLPTSSSPLTTTTTFVTGSFAPTSTLSLRWTRQASTFEPPAILTIPASVIDAEWRIAESGAAVCRVDVTAQFEYNGLRDSHSIDLNVGGSVLPRFSEGQASRDDEFSVISVDGLGVTGWDVLRHVDEEAAIVPGTPAAGATSTRTASNGPRDEPRCQVESGAEDTGNAGELSTLVTPTRRLGKTMDVSSTARRRSSVNDTAVDQGRRTHEGLTRKRTTTSARERSRHGGPPSLFDTVLPVAAPPLLDLDSSLVLSLPETSSLPPHHKSIETMSRSAASSGTHNLLSLEAAPFDPEASGLDMSFEELEHVEAGSKTDSGSERIAEESFKFGPESPDDDAGSERLAQEGQQARTLCGTNATLTTSSEDTTRCEGTTIRVRISLSPLLMSTIADSPTITFRIEMAFPAIALGSRIVEYPALEGLAGAPAPPGPRARTRALVLSLPSFSLAAAQSQETNISVSASDFKEDCRSRSSVELLQATQRSDLTWDEVKIHAPNARQARTRARLNPLPAREGTARWSSSREGAIDSEGVDEVVDVEVLLPYIVHREEDMDTEENGHEGTAPPGLLVDLNGATPKLRAKKDRHRVHSGETALEPLARTPPSRDDAKIIGVERSMDRNPVRCRPTPSPSSAASPFFRVQITPISPTLSLASPSPSDWRIFYRLVFANPSTRAFTIPVSSDSRVKVHDVWGSRGRPVRFDRRELGDGPRNEVGNGDGSAEIEEGLRISIADADRDPNDEPEGIREVLYEERKFGDAIEGAALLPFLDSKVCQYEVEVLEAQGECNRPLRVSFAMQRWLTRVKGASRLRTERRRARFRSRGPGQRWFEAVYEIPRRSQLSPVPPTSVQTPVSVLPTARLTKAASPELGQDVSHSFDPVRSVHEVIRMEAVPARDPTRPHLDFRGPR